jgi:gliding motility-associated-like protein
MQERSIKPAPQFLSVLAFLLVSALCGTTVHAQDGALPTRGTRFWTGFMQNGFGAQSLKLHIMSTVATQGTISIPGNGWNTSFTVGANSVSVINVPLFAESAGSGVVAAKGILVTSQDSIDLYSSSFQNYTHDLSQLLPETSLGSSYRVDAYQGLPNFNNLHRSEFLVVATADGTQVRITPAALTADGRPANVPFTVDLNAGESYQVQAALDVADLTGSTVEATETSGACRPFVVIGGSMCASAPGSCSACDAIFDQLLPRSAWGTRYFTVPINGVITATYRIMADVDNTTVTIDGNTTVTLNAGQRHEVNGSNVPVCIEASAPVSVVQLLEGYLCAGNGDPSLMVLSPAERISRTASFHASGTAQVNQYSVSVVVPTNSIGQLTLDGTVVSSSLFQAYAGCTDRSHAKIPMGSGVHRLASPAGFQAYLFGIGYGESYASSVNSISAPPVQQDSIVCGGGSITLQAPIPLNNATWTVLSDPGTVIGTGLSLTVTPTASDSYVVSGELAVSGCPRTFTFHVGIPLTLPTLLTANDQPSISVCQYEAVQLALDPPPDPAWFDIEWWPASSLSDPNSATPIATPQATTWYKVSVTSPSGCGTMLDSILVTVAPAQIIQLDVTATPDTICQGTSAQLNSQALRVMASDNFDGGSSPTWTAIQGGTPSNICGSHSGLALRFNGNGARYAQTVGINTSGGGEVRFRLMIAQGTAPCDNADPGEGVVLEYSTNNGLNWSNMASFGEDGYGAFTPIEAVIPAPAQSGNTMFRIRQLANSGVDQDNWAIDEFFVTRYDSAWLSYAWSGTGVASPAAFTSSATPTTSGWYTLSGTDPTAGCIYSDSIYIHVDPAFSISLPNDTTLCAVNGMPLQAIPSFATDITYSWTPNNGSLSSTTSGTTIATPQTTTTYTVQATTASGCADSDAITITVGQLLDLVVNADQDTICQGQSVALTAIATGGTGLSYTWTGGTISNPGSATPTAQPNATTTYTCTVTHMASGCSLSGSTTIVVTTGYVVNAGPDLSECSLLGQELNVTHNIPNPTYSWTPASHLNAANIQSPTILVDESTVLTVTVTDVNGCSATDQITTTRAFENVPTQQSMVACANVPPTLTAPATADGYAWNTGATTASIVPSASGAFTVTMTDAQGCEAFTTFNVLLNPLPVIDLGPDLAICGSTPQVLNAANSGSSYLWSTGATSQTISVTNNGTYSVLVTNINNCAASDAVNVVFNSLPTDVLQDVTACATAPVMLDAGNPGSTYLWNDGATSQTVEVGTSGTYTVTITSAQGCSITASADVDMVEPPVVDLGPGTAICSGTSIELVGALTGTGLQYLWSTGASTPTITVDQAGTYSLTVTNGPCTVTDDVQVALIAAPEDVLTNVTQCIDIPLVLNAGNVGSTYLWNTGATTATQPVSTGGTYSVTITGSSGCTATYDAVVQLTLPPVIQLGADTVLCEGEVLQLNAGNPGSTYLWNTGATTRQVNVRETGTYAVTVNNGCVRSDSIAVFFNPSPARMAVTEFHTCLDDEPRYVLLDAGNPGSRYDWSTGASSQVIMAGAYGTYYVQVTNQYDCSVRDSAQVHEFCPATVFVPNTFTPNGDGLNDLFLPVGKSIAEIQFRVFDRWGELLFQTNDLETGWDGTYRGELVKNDMYVWRMTYTFFTDEDGTMGMEQSQIGQIQVLH